MTVTALRKPEKKYTYTDYCSWPDEERWEIIDGTVYGMTSPKRYHQRISMCLSEILESTLKGKKCVPFHAPFDVVFSPYDVVQPDLFVVCDPQKMTDDNIQGAPDFIIEILSPSTSENDLNRKKDLYEKNRVKEYLIIDPVYTCVYQHILGENGKFTPYKYYNAQQEIHLISLPGLTLPLWSVFEVEKITEAE